MIRLALLVLLLAAPAAAQPPAANEDLSKDFDKFWEEEEFKDDYLDGTGTGGGPAMVWRELDLDAANRKLVDAGLIALPEKSLNWGGAGWYSMHTGDKLFIALGGGGYGGAGESQRGEDFSRISRGAGYFAVKGVLPLHKRLFLEAGLALGGGASKVTVERTETGSGIIQVYLRGERRFLLLRPHLGLDLRLARWAGILVEGGYEFTSGDWSLEGERELTDTLDFGDDAGRFIAVTIRFGI
jgi:hypothetical protein